MQCLNTDAADHHRTTTRPLFAHCRSGSTETETVLMFHEGRARCGLNVINFNYFKFSYTLPTDCIHLHMQSNWRQWLVILLLTGLAAGAGVMIGYTVLWEVLAIDWAEHGGERWKCLLCRFYWAWHLARVQFTDPWLGQELHTRCYNVHKKFIHCS